MLDDIILVVVGILSTIGLIVGGLVPVCDEARPEGRSGNEDDQLDDCGDGRIRLFRCQLRVLHPSDSRCAVFLARQTFRRFLRLFSATFGRFPGIREGATL